MIQEINKLIEYIKNGEFKKAELILDYLKEFDVLPDEYYGCKVIILEEKGDSIPDELIDYLINGGDNNCCVVGYPRKHN